MNFSIALLLLACTEVVCKFESMTALFPFSQPLLAWDIAGTHMMISTDTPISQVQFYNFDTQYVNTLPYPNLAGIVMVATHESNTNNSYCLVYQLSNTTAQRISQNSSCINGTNYNVNAMLKGDFGPTVDAFYAS